MSIRQSISITHQNKIFIVEKLISDNDIQAAKEIDDTAFENHEGISLSLIKKIADIEGLWGIREAKRLVGETQIITEPLQGVSLGISEAVCYGTAVKKEYRGKSYGIVLAKAQEEIARQRGKTKLKLTVRPENKISILLRRKLGFCFSGYDAQFYGKEEGQGARLIMSKDLNLSEDPVGEGRDTYNDIKKVRITPGDDPDYTGREQLKHLLSNGYSIIDYRSDESDDKFNFILVTENEVHSFL